MRRRKGCPRARVVAPAPSISDDVSMWQPIWIGIGILVAVVVVVWASRRMRRARNVRHDLGTISGQWINEQRMHQERDDR
jgi:hypothetical protein